MLQGIRDIKGTLATVVVVLFFIVPLVLTGVGDSFLGSVAGNDVASVDGKAVSSDDLGRAVYLRKQSLLSRDGVDPTSDFLKDENLRGPVLDSLTKRLAMSVSSLNGGMGVSDEILNRQITEQQQFHVGGKFDSQTYRRILANYGYTPTTYKEALSEDLLIQHQMQALGASAFVTEFELDTLIALSQQKRTFSVTKITAEDFRDGISADATELDAYYQENQAQFVEPEKTSVSYIELSVDQISSTITVDAEEVKQQFESELASFAAETEYEVAHILLEDSDDVQARVTEIQGKLAGGEAFAELASQYSDDSGTKGVGGSLGVLTPGIFPEAFEEAVYALGEGEVSQAVETDAGTHIIKVLKKVVDQAPVFEDRKIAIENQLRQVQAEDIFVESLERLGELTFSASDLEGPASELGLTIQTTQEFTRVRGQGIAADAKVRDAAFSSEVLDEGYNSKILELSDRQAVVLHKLTHQEEFIKPFADVESVVKDSVINKKLQEFVSAQAEATIAALASGEDGKAYAESNKYEYSYHEAVSRSEAGLDFAVSNKAFSMVGGDVPTFESEADGNGNYFVVGLIGTQAGTREDLREQQLVGFTTQLSLQNGAFETAAFEAKVIEDADIDKY